jgi:signal transduction histidine kinase
MAKTLAEIVLSLPVDKVLSAFARINHEVGTPKRTIEQFATIIRSRMTSMDQSLPDNVDLYLTHLVEFAEGVDSELLKITDVDNLKTQTPKINKYLNKLANLQPPEDTDNSDINTFLKMVVYCQRRINFSVRQIMGLKPTEYMLWEKFLSIIRDQYAITHAEQNVNIKYHIPKDFETSARYDLELTNLLQNAFKYAFPEENDRERGIEIQVQEKDDHYQVAVSNTGVRIDPDTVYKKIMELSIYDGEEPGDEPSKLDFIFHEGFTTDSDRGNGMGLHSIRQSIEEKDGRIWVESTEEMTTFNFTIPKEYVVNHEI